MAATGQFLGLIEDLTATEHGGALTVQVKPAFRESLIHALEDALAAGRLQPGATRSLIGKLLFQSSALAGRAGRGLQQGRVLIQTHHPDHPLLRTLLQHGYAEFSKAALDERRRALLPPWSSMTLLRAEATSPAAVMSFLSEASRQASRQSGSKHIRILGPVPAAMERKAGRYRAQLLIESEHRATIQRFLGDWIAALSNLKLSRRVRWSVDVDPQEMN